MKQCKECGIEFEPKNPKGVFCSVACRQKDYRKKIADNLRFLEKNQSPSPKVISPELTDQIAENNLPKNKKRILKERKGKYAVGEDPHSKGPSKGKTVVYKKGSKKNPISSEEAVAIYNAEHPEQHSEIESAKKYKVSLPDGTYPDVEKELEQKVAEYLAESTTPEMRAKISKIAQEKVFGPSWEGKAKVIPVKDPVSLNLPALVRGERQKSIDDQIKAIKAEKVPKERDTSNGRKSWAYDQQKRIKELETKLK